MTRISLAALASAAILAGSATIATAQQATTPPSSAQSGARTERGARGQRGERALFRGITLTDAQKSQLAAVRTKYSTEGKELRAQMKASHEKGARPDSALMVRRRTLMESERNDTRAILTAEQRVTFDQNITQMRDRMKTHRGKRQAGH